MTGDALVSGQAARAVLAIALLAGAAAPVKAVETRRLDFADLASLKSVSDPQLSPEGNWVAYVVRTTDLENDRINKPERPLCTGEISVRAALFRSIPGVSFLPR